MGFLVPTINMALLKSAAAVKELNVLKCIKVAVSQPICFADMPFSCIKDFVVYMYLFFCSI